MDFGNPRILLPPTMSMSDNGDHNSETIRTIYDEATLDVNPQSYFAPFLKQARWISQSIHPYISIRRIFYAGVYGVGNEGAVLGYSKEEIFIFNAIMKLHPNFRTIVDAIASTKEARFLLFIKEISDASCASRADDTSKLKSSILGYIFEDLKTGPTFPRDLKSIPSDSKSPCGIWMAYHLCPLKFKSAFEDDPRAFLDRIKYGSIILTAHDLPSFLYDSKVRYDENDEVTGLFRGFLLVRVYRHIFTGPSTAINPTAKTSKSKARVFNMETVTGRTIAYASTYIALMMTRWDVSHENFRLDTFYNKIVSMFETNAHSPWVKETLSWWNIQVPGIRMISQFRAGPRAADQNSSQLHARLASQSAPQQVSPSQGPSFLQQPSLTTPRHTHMGQTPLPNPSYREEPMLSRSQQLSAGASPEDLQSSRPHKRRRPTDDEDQERPFVGRLTSVVDWGNPHYFEYDSDESR